MSVFVKFMANPDYVPVQNIPKSTPTTTLGFHSVELMAVSRNFAGKSLKTPGILDSHDVSCFTTPLGVFLVTY
jgi:hypothetical protein